MASPNGKLTAAELAAVASAPGHRLRADAAIAWDRLAGALQAKHGWKPNPTDSYRPYAKQEEIFRDRYRTTYTEYAPGKTDRRTWNGVSWWRRPDTASASTPGRSNHGLGIAVDGGPGLNSYAHPRWAQFAALAPAYGWTNTEGRQVDEPWHWVYNPATDMRKTSSEEDDMYNEADRARDNKTAQLIETALSNTNQGLVARIWNRIIHRGPGVTVIQEIANIRTTQLATMPTDESLP